MSDIPLIEKEYGSWADGVISKVRIMEISKECGGEVNTDWWFKKSDVVSALRKYKKYESEMFKYFKKYPEEIMIFIKSENELFQILNNCGSKQCEGVMYDDYINEFNNWLWNKIIGKLPEEKELSKR